MSKVRGRVYRNPDVDVRSYYDPRPVLLPTGWTGEVRIDGTLVCRSVHGNQPEALTWTCANIRALWLARGNR